MSVSKNIIQLGKESIIYGLSGVTAKSIGIFLVPIYTRIFLPDDYGVIALIETLLSLLGMFVILGLDDASARWFYDTDEESGRRKIISSWFWCQITVSILFSILLFIFPSYISKVIFSNPDQNILIKLAAFLIPLGTCSKVLQNWLRYQRRAWTTSIYATVNTFLSIGIILIFVLVYKWGVAGIFSARILAGVIMAIVVIFILKKWISPLYFSISKLKEMWAYGLPLVPAAIASWVTSSSDRFILQMYHDAAEVGLYSLAFSVASTIAILTTAFQKAWGPFAYSIIKTKDSLKTYSEVLNLYGLFGCALATIIAVFAPYILFILATPKYYDAASCVSFLVFSYILIGSTYIVATGSGIAKNSKPIAISIFIGACLNILLNFILIPRLGKDGAAIATLFSYVGVLIYRYIMAQRDYYIPYKPLNMIIYFIFSWVLIAVDHFYLSQHGYVAFFIRTGMCMLFLPLAFVTRIVKPIHIIQIMNRGKLLTRPVKN